MTTSSFPVCAWLLVVAAVMGPPAVSAETPIYPPRTTSFELGSMPALPMPSYLGTVTEPGLGTVITRITDQGAFATTQRIVAHSYPTMETWNCDGTRMLITQGQYPYVLLDGRTYAISGRHRPPQGSIWSPTEPNIMYGIRSNSPTEQNYVSFDVSTDTFTILKTFSDYTGLRYSGEEHVSNDGKYTCLLGYKGEDLYLISFDIARREMIAEKRLGKLAVGDDNPNGVNAIMMSQKGTYIAVVYKSSGTGGTQGVHLYDRNLNYLRFLMDSINHSDMGLDENGDEVYVGQNGETQRAIFALRLRDNRKTIVLDNEKMGYNQHISCRNLARPGWAYVSDFELGNAPRPNENKVFALKLDGSQTVEFFAWARRSEAIEYDRGVMVSPSPDGTKVVFRSDWGDASDQAVVYSYVATMPAPAGNTPPTIDSIADQSTPAATPTGPITVTVGDAETAPSALRVAAASGNQTLVSSSGIVLGGSGTNRSLTITPTAGQVGSASITVTVTDGGGVSASRTFTLTVTPTAPAFTTQPADRSVTMGTSATFTVAVGGTPTPTLQWQRLAGDTWTVISGATQASYTTAVTVASDDGSRFRAVASNSAGSVTSGEARLTVTQPSTGGSGLRGIYFDNPDFTGERMRRIDPQIAFEWGYAAPAADMGAETFSVRWEGEIDLPQSGAWTLTTRSDDGVRVWIDGQLLIDRWSDQAPSEHSGTRTLPAGRHALRVDYYENQWGAVAQLFWSHATVPKALVPSAHLYPPANAGLPAGWTSADVGAVSVPGSADVSADTWTLAGAGADIWNTSDGFRFAHRELQGDGEITARVLSLQRTHAWAKAGVMIRASTAAGAAHAFICLTPDNGAAFQRRVAAGGASAHTAGPLVVAPTWVRLTRVGSSFQAWTSANGSTWSPVGGPVTIAMPASVRIGLAVTSHDAGVATQARFDQVAVIAAASANN